MDRMIYKKLVDWNRKKKRKPLVLLGARQVGKTYILKEFGRKEFQNMIYVNCHREDFANELFRNLNPNRIINDLENFYGTKVTDGKTLIFFDEIQEIRGGLASLKYFCEDRPNLHVAVAGSLLGLSIHENESYPVGKIEVLRMYPMTFSEFLWAKGRHGLSDIIENLDWDSMKAFHDHLTSLLREYYFVGGMPEVVQQYVNTGDTIQVREIQDNIIDAYMRDISKHSATLTQRIRLVWDSIPSQLSRENKKFIFGALKKGARAADFELALQWLTDAGIIYKVNRTKVPNRPLKFYADPSAFKVYMADCGLLSCICHAPAREMLVGSSAFTEYKGALTENYILQQLRAITDSNDIFYFAKDNSSQEIDFILETEHRTIPIEVKAETNVKSKSLYGFINNDHPNLHLKGLRVSMLPYADQGWMENIPLYAIEAFIRREMSM